MSELVLGGDSWEDRNDSEERVPCAYCGVAISALELGVVKVEVLVGGGGFIAHADCAALQAQREGDGEGF